MEEKCSLSFLKMQALGNDFVVFPDAPVLSSKTITTMAHRRFGVGCDQVLILRPPKNSTSSDAILEIWNADGTQAEACGNGTRCVMHYLSTRPPFPKKIRLQTLQCILEGQVFPDGEVQVEQGTPTFPLRGQTLDLKDWGIPPGIPVYLGNPHLVVFVSDLEALDVASLGAQLEHHPFFPNRTNVMFVKRVSPDQLSLRIWERGAGMTLACGSGACAAVCAAIHHKKVSASPIQVALEGGVLTVTYEAGRSVFHKGPVQLVYEGVWLGTP